MNAQELIAKAIDIIDDPDYADRAVYLDYLNQAQRDVAQKILMPDLADGHSTVNTITAGFAVILPTTFHRNLFMAHAGGKALDIHEDISTFEMMLKRPISMTTGDVEGVTTNGRNLLYQGVPSAVVAIDLFYYRFPADMTDVSTSFPDGFKNTDAYDWALIHLACAKIFNRIEDGTDGAKINTSKHEEKYAEHLMSLDYLSLTEGRAYKVRPKNVVLWPN